MAAQWKAVPTTTVFLSCAPPFSFYKLIQEIWVAKRHCTYSLHRVLSLTRKMRVATIVLEDALGEPHIGDEIDDLNAACGSGGTAQAIRLSFFTVEVDRQSVSRADPQTFLGFAYLINYAPPSVSWEEASGCHKARSYIHESVLRFPTLITDDGTPSASFLLNNYYHCKRDYETSVDGNPFSVSGTYYCQQNGVTSCCAHACLRMAINSGPIQTNITTREINQILGSGSPARGLYPDEIEEVAKHCGYAIMRWDFFKHPTEDYVQLLYSIVESDCPALLVFTTKEGLPSHVIPAFGHTLNSDEWYPEARIAYSGPPEAQYHPSSSWVDHFLVHDDNFGPYYCLSPSSLRKLTMPWADRTLRAKEILGFLPKRTAVDPYFAENVATLAISKVVPVMMTVEGVWGDALRKYTEGFGTNRNFVLRTFQMRKKKYREHLLSASDHAGGASNRDELGFLRAFPLAFWVTEVSLPDLYTANQTKLGEVLVKLTKASLHQDLPGLVAVRLPHLVMEFKNSKLASIHEVSIDSHYPLAGVPQPGVPGW